VSAITMTDREQIEDFLRLVLAAANQIQKLIPDFRGVVEADDFSMSDLLRLQPAFSWGRTSLHRSRDLRDSYKNSLLQGA
jgi:hypothetical protein